MKLPKRKDSSRLHTHKMRGICTYAYIMYYVHIHVSIWMGILFQETLYERVHRGMIRSVHVLECSPVGLLRGSRAQELTVCLCGCVFVFLFLEWQVLGGDQSISTRRCGTLQVRPQQNVAVQ